MLSNREAIALHELIVEIENTFTPGLFKLEKEGIFIRYELSEWWDMNIVDVMVNDSFQPDLKKELNEYFQKS